MFGQLRLVPFAHGFRPFFLGAIAYAVLAIGVWLWIRATGTAPLVDLPPQLWHGHEMLFGFVPAAIAGFLLTAVPSWTGARGFAGAPLILLFALWLAGRIGFAFAAYLPVVVLTVADLLFLPALALMIAPSLVRTRNRNTPLLAVLVALWIVDAVFLYAMAQGNLPLATNALRVGIDIVLLLITVIGGRIVPSFTANALRRRGITSEVRSRRWVDVAAITLMVLVVLIDAVTPAHPAAAIAAGLAALAHAIRLSGWQGSRSLEEPLVWILHAAYLWLPVGLALKAIYLITGADWAAQWLHGLTIGAAATMVMAVITRASLGHTGRPLSVPRSVAVAYGLIGAAALVRVFVTPLATHREWAIVASGILWVAAFAIVLVVYAPILLGPRVNGRAG